MCLLTGPEDLGHAGTSGAMYQHRVVATPFVGNARAAGSRRSPRLPTASRAEREERHGLQQKHHHRRRHQEAAGPGPTQSENPDRESAEWHCHGAGASGSTSRGRGSGRGSARPSARPSGRRRWRCSGGAGGATVPTEDDYLTKVVKYVPVEILAAYLLMAGVIDSNVTNTHDHAIWLGSLLARHSAADDPLRSPGPQDRPLVPDRDEPRGPGGVRFRPGRLVRDHELVPPVVREYRRPGLRAADRHLKLPPLPPDPNG